MTHLIRLDRPIVVPTKELPKKGMLFLERSRAWPEETAADLSEYITEKGGGAQMSVHILSAIFLICDDLKAMGIDTAAIDCELQKYERPSKIEQWSHRSFVLPAILVKSFIDELPRPTKQTLTKIDSLMDFATQKPDFLVWLCYQKFRIQYALNFPIYEKWEYVDYAITLNREWGKGLGAFFQARYREDMHEDPPYAMAFSLALHGLGYDTDWELAVINDEEIEVEVGLQPRFELYMQNDTYHTREFLAGHTIANLPRTLQSHFGTKVALYYTRLFIEAKIYLAERGDAPYFDEVELLELGDWPVHIDAFFKRELEKENTKEEELAILLAQKCAGVDAPTSFHRYSKLMQSIDWEGSFVQPSLTIEGSVADRFIECFNGNTSFTYEEAESWEIKRQPDAANTNLDTRLACHIAQLFIRSWIPPVFQYKFGDGYTWPEKTKQYILDLQIEDSDLSDLLARYFVLQHVQCNGEVNPLMRALQEQDLSLPPHVEFPEEFADVFAKTISSKNPKSIYTLLVHSLRADNLTFMQQVSLNYWKYYVAQQF